jgi:periplasmic protein TonB
MRNSTALMDTGSLSSEQSLGLVAAIAFHAALLASLVMNPVRAPVIAPPERISVTLAEDVGHTSTSPEPQAAPAPETAPMIGEALEPEVQPVPLPEPKPLPVIKPQGSLAPAKLPSIKPLPRAIPSAAPSHTAQRIIPKSSGASKIGSDFLQGVAGAPASGTARNLPAAAIGASVRSALSGAIARELKPHWQGKVPQGAEAEKLVTVLAWNLNSDGSLAGTPRVVRQDGITDANRSQAARHAEQAIRSVQLAAPFNLPAEYYEAWKRVGPISFDKRLSQ